jgi:hypothetical protein
MATVYLADDLRHGHRVALKVLKPELAAIVGAARFLAEIRTTASLQHRHILPLFDSGEADKLFPPSPTPSLTSSSTSPCPTTSTSEAPESGRPAGDSPPARPRPSVHLGGPLRHLELSRLARRTLAPASAPVSASPLLCLVTSVPRPTPLPATKAL